MVGHGEFLLLTLARSRCSELIWTSTLGADDEGDHQISDSRAARDEEHKDLLSGKAN